jgi:hypothetical protein
MFEARFEQHETVQRRMDQTAEAGIVQLDRSNTAVYLLRWVAA